MVRTDSTAWATQLRLLAPTVVRRLNEELGHGTVAVIEVLGPHAAVLEEGPALGPRRPRAARHLRLSADRRPPADAPGRNADLRAARTYRDPSDPLLGRSEPPSRAAQRAIFLHRSPRLAGSRRGMRAS